MKNLHNKIRYHNHSQEKNITAKVPVTPNAPPNSASNKKANQKSKQPLYLALRASAAKKKATSKTEMAQKIKEQAHLNAVKNYTVPPLPKEYYENMLKLQNNSFLSEKKKNNGSTSHGEVEI